MITRGIQDYVGRDWDAVRLLKDRYWRDRIDGLGPAEAFRIAEQLRLQMVARDPSWPGGEARRDDLRFHVRLAEIFQHADAARRR